MLPISAAPMISSGIGHRSEKNHLQLVQVFLLKHVTQNQLFYKLVTISEYLQHNNIVYQLQFEDA